ncbi:hypothetical protein C8R44DRAFT_785522 [Mycena epipterygia]|nr:hypothetical protein C8R44DRAFT_785522 [Mycena epipterygia]
MFSRLTSTLALALTLISLSSGAAAVSCGVCAPTIFFEGLTRTLTNTRQDTDNTFQCTYATPAISGLAPACVYRNIDGGLTFTNTGSPGACPSVQLVQKTAC